MKAEENEIRDVVKLTIADDKLVGTGTAQYSGYSRSHYLSQIGDASNKTRFEMIKSLVLKGNNKFSLIKYTEENLKDRDKPYVVSYNFDIANYILKVNQDTYVNLSLDKIYEKLTIEKDRLSKFDFDFLTFTNNRFELEIPAGNSIKYLPKNTSIDNALLQADLTYETSKTSIALNVKIRQKKLLIDNRDFELWNQTVKQLKSAYSENIILSEK